MFNPLSLDTAHVADTLGVMIQKEKCLASCTNYFQQYSFDSSAVVDEQDRAKMVDWCYKIVDECKLDRECVAMAFNMVDQFLSKPATPTHKYLSSRMQYQLLSTTALCTAIRLHEIVAFGSDVFAILCNDFYTKQEIEDMEMELLMGLQWKICTPTSIQMAYSILSLMLPHVSLPDSSWAYLLDEVIFQTEHAVRDYELSLSAMSRPSTVALASILNTLGDMYDEQAHQTALQALLFVIDEFGGQLTSPGELLATRNRLQSLVSHQADNHVEEDGTKQGEEQQQEEEEVASSMRRPGPSYNDVQDYDPPPKYVYIY